jgi:hypothetical protein
MCKHLTNLKMIKIRLCTFLKKCTKLCATEMWTKGNNYLSKSTKSSSVNIIGVAVELMYQGPSNYIMMSI